MDELYRTRSLPVASFLYICEGVKLIGFDKTDPKNVYFQFSPRELCEKLEDDYTMDRVSVSPRKLSDANQLLKERIFQIQRNNR